MIEIQNPNRFRTLPKAVLFDTDNTLYPYDPAHAAAMNAVRDKASRVLSIPGKTFDAAFAEARATINKRLQHTASSHSRLLYFQSMLENVALRSQVLLALDLEQTYWRSFLTAAKLFDGVTDLLDDMRLLGIPTAIITDLTAQIQFRKIIYFGLDRYFDYIVTSEEAGFDKPHEAPFKLALEKIRPEPGPIWMIGDNPHNDIYGAAKTIDAVTLQKLHKNVEKGTGEQSADATFSEFSELKGLLAKTASNAGKGVT